MDRLDVCIIGAGRRAREAIFPALSGLKGVRLAGVCDLNPEAAESAAKEFGIEHVYSGDGKAYIRMVEERKPSAVACIGQPHLLYDIYGDLLERGVNLLIEKPLGLTHHEAKALAWLAEKNGCVTQVALQRRYTPLVVEMRERCLQHGPVTHAVCKFYKAEPQPFTGARDHLLDDTVHSVDTLRWMCGGEVVDVKSEMKRVGTPDINFISATLSFDNGSTGYFINSWSSGKREFSVEMHAPGAFARAEHEVEAYLYENGDVEGVRYGSEAVAGSSRYPDFTGVTAMAEDFIRHVREGGQPQCCFQNTLKTMDILFKILAENTCKEWKRG
jgi:virulence factor